MVIVKVVKSGDAHKDQKWLVLEGSVEGVPQVTKRRSINTSALADGSLTLEAEKARLVADVEEYHARYLAVQEALRELS